MTKRNTFKILTDFACLLAFLLAGCLEAPVEPTNVVKGTALYYYWPYEPAYTFVRIKDLPECETRYDGAFQLSYVSVPYNLIITDSDWPTTKYLSIKNLNPVVYSMNYFPDHTSQNRVTICFPQVSPNRIIYIKFIGTENVIQLNYAQYVTEIPSNQMIIQVQLPPNVNQVEGKLMYLQAKIDPVSEQTTEFEKFGLINAFVANGDITQRFEGSDIVPAATAFARFNITGYTSALQNTTAVLSCMLFSVKSELELSNNSGSNSTGLTPFPVISGESFFYVKVLSEGYQNGSHEKKWIYLDSQGNAEISFDRPFSLMLPHNQQTNVTDSTIFEISDDGKPGVYAYWISNILGGYNAVITDKKIINFGDFQGTGVTYKHNTQYSWYVTKYGEYNSIDDFVSSNYVYDSRFNSESTSDTCTFTTAP